MGSFNGSCLKPVSGGALLPQYYQLGLYPLYGRIRRDRLVSEIARLQDVREVRGTYGIHDIVVKVK